MSRRHARSVLFYVQHMLGVGHIFRARRLIQGLSENGYAVDVVFGGVPVADMEFAARSITFLPPVKAGAIDYSFYTDGEGNQLTKTYLAGRRDKLLSAFENLEPDLVIIEQFPFGRRVLRGELIALLERTQARPHRPKIICSVRDILQEKRKAGRTEEAVETIERYFDAVLVHSDPSVISLDATLSLAHRISDKLHYSGFVVPAGEDKMPAEPFDVIITAGGGAFGATLLHNAVAAFPFSSLQQLRWCLVTGPNLPEEDVAELRDTAPSQIAIRTFLPQLWHYLKQARLSISQSGYNTVADVLRAGCRSVVVPSDTTGQTEQLRRAQLLSEAGLVVSVPESELSPERLASAMDEAMALPPSDRNFDVSGIETSVRIIDRLVGTRTV